MSTGKKTKEENALMVHALSPITLTLLFPPRGGARGWNKAAHSPPKTPQGAANH